MQMWTRDQSPLGCSKTSPHGPSSLVVHLRAQNLFLVSASFFVCWAAARLLCGTGSGVCGPDRMFCVLWTL